MTEPALEEDDLPELLRRCHRDELEPLAGIVRVPAGDLGLRDLARVTAAALCRLGTHELANAALRGGRGLPYGAVLRRVAERYGVEAATVAELERGVVRAHFSKRWNELGPGLRGRLWEEMGLALPLPPDGDSALDRIGEVLGRGADYALSESRQIVNSPAGVVGLLAFHLSPFGCLFRAALAPFVPVLLWWYFRADEERLLRGVLEVARLRQTVLHRVTVGVVGSPSTGKDAAIKALFGIETGNISPIAGSTKEVTIQRLPGSTALYVVNTPGMGDVVERVTEEARQVLDHIDVFVYLVNAEGGVQARELADYRTCVASGKPVLAVVNKVDVLRPADRDAFLADTRSKLGAPAEDFLAAAFDPLPQLSPVPIGLAPVHSWLRDHLAALGKNPDELPPLAVA